MFLEDTFIYCLAAFTSAVIFFVGLNKLGLKTSGLRVALRDLVQCIGAFMAFFLVNLFLGTALVFLIRGVWRFFPLYTLADAGLFVVSALQGFIFQLWWRGSQQSPG